MKKIHKNLLLIAIILFAISIIYVPETAYMSDGRPMNFGWSYIWDLTYEVNLKIVIIEWVGIVAIGLGLFYYFKD